MFVGHTALALAAKRRAPEVSLAWLLASAVALDLLWPFFLLLGIETVAIPADPVGFTHLSFTWYPWSHSLVMALVWAVMGTLLALICRASTRTALLIGALVLSHWVLDWFTHARDLPLWPGDSPLEGLDLWASIPWTFVVEGALYAAGIWIYLKSTRAADRVGTLAFWGFIVLPAVLWASGPFTPPPPTPMAVAWSTMIAVPLLVVWGWWVDRHRVPLSKA